LFDFQGLMIVLTLIICMCAYVRDLRPGLINSRVDGFSGLFRKAAVIGDRLSPWVSLSCVLFAYITLFLR
jgi:hypothetical protein